MYGLLMAGIDYNKSLLEIREKTSFTRSGIEAAYKILREVSFIKEAIIISTCNRSELYIFATDEVKAEEYLQKFYSQFFCIDASIMKENLIIRKNSETILHLFGVAAGLESMILGEDQIMSQVKGAYENALKAKSSGKYLNRLFLNGIAAGKRVRTLTGVAKNPVSTASVGVRLIQKELGDISKKNALIIGLGEISQLTVKYLIDKVDNIFVANRTREVTDKFTDNSNKLHAVDFYERYEYLPLVDIVISCTSAPHFVLHYDELIKHYGHKKLCILDLAMPRDVEPEIGITEGISLYILDDLDKIVKENLEKRKNAVADGEKIIGEDLVKFEEWFEKAVSL